MNMNQEKAREFFSAYYEGTLENGLRQTLEQRLRADAQLLSEYASFEETMSELDSLKFEEIEVPMYLSDRIATRLEAVQEKQATKTFVWPTWLRALSVSGVAGLAILGAVLSLNARSSGTAQAGGLTAGQNSMVVENSSGNVVLKYQSSEKEAVDISSDGKVLQHIQLDPNQRLVSPLNNHQAETAVFEVKAGDRTTYIAVPGTQRQNADQTGQGTLKAFAAALAGFYRTPVELDVQDATKSASWHFEAAKAIDAANASLEVGSVSVSESDGGTIVVKDR
jgi:hypothetical protein